MSLENTPVENANEEAKQAESEGLENKVTEGTATESGEGEGKPEDKSPKSFTQEEVDALMGKRLAIEKRRWERKQQERSNNTPDVSSLTEGIDLSQFRTNEELQGFLTKKAEEHFQKIEQQKAERVLLETYAEREEAAIQKYDDFEKVAYNDKLPITEYMAQTIRESELGPDVAYYLGSNMEEAKRISKLSPFNQAKELGKIELKISTNPDTLGKKVSNTPPPVNPGKGKSDGLKSYDTTDPRSVKSMSTSDWIKAERERQIRKIKGG